MTEINLTKENFEEEVLHQSGTVLVDFWATWCGPCRMLAPVIEEIAIEKDGEIKVCKVNVDDEPELAKKYRISSIPTLVVFKDGKIINTALGYRPKEEIEALLK